MSRSLLAADRNTHLKIVTVSLVAVFGLAAMLTAARVGEPDSKIVSANGPTVVKPEKATTWTSDETRAVR
jgi:hypothetical protein